GFSKFSKFTMEAAQKGLLTVTRLENGQLEVAPPAGRGATTTSGAPASGRGATAPNVRAAAPERSNGDRPEGDAEEERARGRRGRRGRGGRGREGREERPSTEVAEQVDREAEEITPVEEAAAPREERPRPDRHRAERPREEPVQRVVVADGIGQSGERLTRDEAFALVRQAVESLTRDEDDAARAGDVRQRARELLGRDSESLGDRMFTRILRDAHDADVIDLRRRGDDFEVARAVAAPSVRDQLARADLSASAATTGTALSSAAAARRGMGPRGIPGGGRGRGRMSGPATPPPDLFAVGVIDEPTPAPVAAPADVAAPLAAEAPTLDADGGMPDDGPGGAPAPATRSRGRSRGGAKRGGRKTAGTGDSASTTSEDAVAAAESPAPAAKKSARRGGRKSASKRAAPASDDSE
ncbi:MAG TPA: hypothetical protein VHM30_10605, partial [Gemmatimonadaceae bacterium]|nr:hypothetical protein [Gemmatimonadaceae bacterium]